MIRKNISRKVTAVAVSLALSIMSSMLVSASYVYEIGWDADPCPRCGAETAIWIREVYEDAKETGIKKQCSHYKFGEDVQMVLPGYREFECQEDGCDCYGIYDMSHYFWECEGYGSPRYD